MTMLDNAVSSIRLGIEDFKTIPADDARALSAIRNLSAGLLLMFKVKLQELSPANSNEAFLKQHVTTGRMPMATPFGLVKEDRQLMCEQSKSALRTLELWASTGAFSKS